SYVGDPSNAVTAVSSGDNADGKIVKAYDAADRRYTYAYSSSTIAGVKRLTQVKAETKTSGTWSRPSGVAEVGRGDYDYYSGDITDVGKTGDLRTVTVTMPMTDSGVSQSRKELYWYYTRAWSDTDGQRGEPHQIKMVVGFEGYRKYDWDQDSNLDDD